MIQKKAPPYLCDFIKKELDTEKIYYEESNGKFSVDCSNRKWTVIFKEAKALNETKEYGIPVLTYSTISNPIKEKNVLMGLDDNCFLISKGDEKKVAEKLWGIISFHKQKNTFREMKFI